ncbi:energy transducer TonB [Caldichromatium japonicum]|uniref:Energy transducer TonB n=1 Tax=Caldichromatium japonicum TaxID=2699430 RepID=A0A6G7VFW0_9GAMM|nr:energy transducer TonB [Caldichromatium japonicum]QIK38755.1 energy transducer TonB [Caldichromatium japonicum]
MPASALSIPFGLRSAYLDTPFVLALMVAVWLHLALLFGLSFAWPKIQPPSESSLEVVLLKDRGASQANHGVGSALAQRSQAGESAHGDAAFSAFGETSQDQGETHGPEATASIPAPDKAAPSASPPPPPLPAQPPTSILTAIASPSPAPPAQESQAHKVDAARILASQGLEVARLTSGHAPEAGAKRQRRRSISASTREFRYASYLDAWAKKVERIGNLNYPQAAREQGLYGSLVLHVAVRKDGSVERIRVVRSSGIGLLDQAAIQIVELSAPFAPFPPDIAAETDVLDIVRTWQFMRGDVLGWEQ